MLPRVRRRDGLRADGWCAGEGYSVEVGRARPEADCACPGGPPDGAVTGEVCRGGVRVRRGRDWCWGDEDGGAAGVVEEGGPRVAPAGWCQVSEGGALRVQQDG